MRRPALPLLLAALATLAAGAGGCDTLDPEPYVEEVVVAAVLVAEAPLPPVRLTRTASVEEVYDGDARTIADAEVTVSLLRDDGTVEQAYAYVYDPRAVSYLPPRIGGVRGGRRYRLDAAVPGQAAPVRAETTVPTAFHVVEPPPDTVRYQDPALPQGPPIRITASAFPGRQAAYVFTTQALAPDSFLTNAAGGFDRAFLPGRYGPTPFVGRFVADGDVAPRDVVVGNSPVLNEANYERNADGTLTIRLPWLAVNFYGPQRLTATALDDALVAFIQSQAIQFIPTTLSPGEIPEAVSNVEHGRGVFGAVAQVEIEAFIAE